MDGRPQALLLDVQGVLVDNGVALAGALDTLREARRRGLAIRLVTNTATRHHEQLLQELFTAPLALVHPAIAPLFQGLGGEEGPSRAVDGRTACCWVMPSINSATPTSIGLWSRCWKVRR